MLNLLKMKKIILFLTLFVFCIIISDFLTNYAFTWNHDAPPGNTGSPGDGQTCQQSGCHTSSAPVQNGGLVTSNIPATGYIPGNTYTITASVTGNANKFGVQVSPQNNSGTISGTLVTTNRQLVENIWSLGYITHTMFGTAGSGSKSWSFDWIAPASGSGNVTFYSAFLVADNNNNVTGDTVKLTSLTINEDISNNKDITAFKFSALNPEVIGTINQSAQTVELNVPYGTDVTNLVPVITHTGTSINPSSGSVNDFSSPQSYIVTAQNASTKTYTINVNVELNSSKDITSFKFPNLSPEVIGFIDENAQTIELTVPDGTDLVNLVPTIIHIGDSINPPSGIANDFSSPQDYTVTAENGSTKTYLVIVTEAGDSKNITSFKFSALTSEVIGTIDQIAQTVELTVPNGTDVTNLVPTITYTGNSINPPSEEANDFSSSQNYTVTAKNGTTKSYTISVSIATAVTTYDLKPSLEIYPNPVSDKVFIKQTLSNKPSLVTVVNKNGKIVKAFTVFGTMESFDVSELLPGIYFIKAETEKESIIKKIIKY